MSIFFGTVAHCYGDRRLMNTQTTDKQQFIEQFDAAPGVDLTVNGLDTSTDDVQVSDDQTIMWADDNIDGFGMIDFSEYHEPEGGWSMGYANWGGDTHGVYIFHTHGTRTCRVVIDADKLEAVADLLDRTPADVAEDVLVCKSYPIVIPIGDGEHIAIAPVAPD